MTNLHRSLQIFFWSYAFLYIVLCSLHLTQVDLWYQLAEGFHILQTGTLPTAPAVAYGLPANPYIDEYAGYEIVLVLLFKVGGFIGLWLVFAAIYLGIMFLPIATSGRKYPAFDFSTTLATLFAGILMFERLEQRPELVAGLYLVLLMVLLRSARLEKISARTLAALFFLFVAWTNTHSTFVIGFFTMGLWGACEIGLKFRSVPLAALARGATALGATAVIATCVNPYGPKRLLFPFQQVADPGSTTLSPEMWPLDPHTVAGELVIISVILLAWGLVTTKKVPVWLILFSIFAVFMAFKSLRFMNFLAIAMLFVYAGRTEVAPSASTALPIRVVKDVMLCVLCVFLIFGDAYSFFFTYDEMRNEPQLGVHTRKLGDSICAIHVTDSQHRVPVLCGHGTGSYLSFGDKQFRPMLDSGLSHFSDDTKRYFFFLWHEPEALGLGLQKLDVNYIIINQDTFHWISTIHQTPGWKFVACDTQAMLLERVPDAPTVRIAPDADERQHIEETVKEMEDGGEITGAFEYSTWLDEPEKSLDIIERYGSREWPESLFNHFRAWVATLPAPLVERYLAGDHPHVYPLIDAVLSSQIGPEAFAKYEATNPPGPHPWFFQALEVEAALKKGDLDKAKSTFDSIRPVPVSSATYYALWHEVNGANAPGLSAYGQWQTWDDDARSFMGTMAARLNNRAAELERN